jgi:hypothetical protein
MLNMPAHALHKMWHHPQSAHNKHPAQGRSRAACQAACPDSTANSVQIDEEELLNRKLLDARGSLAAAYAALNDNYERSMAIGSNAPPEIAMSGDHDSADHDPSHKSGKASSLSYSEKSALKGEIKRLQDLQVAHEQREKNGGIEGAMGHSDYTDPRQQVAAYHVQRSHLLTVVRCSLPLSALAADAVVDAHAAGARGAPVATGAPPAPVAAEGPCCECHARRHSQPCDYGSSGT